MTIRLLLLLAFLLSLFLALFAAASASAQTAKVVTFATDEQKVGGFVLELTTAALKKVGYEVNVEFLPWPRAVQMAFEGKVDALMGCWYSDERAQKLAYSEPVAESPLVFFSLKSANIHYTNLDDLRGYTIGITHGSVYPKDFIESQHFKIDSLGDDYIINIYKLVYGHINLFVEKKYVVLSYIETMASPEIKAAQIIALDPPLAVNMYYNGFSRNTQNMEQKLKDFNKGLQMIKDDGTYARIMSKGLHE